MSKRKYGGKAWFQAMGQRDSMVIKPRRRLFGWAARAYDCGYFGQYIARTQTSELQKAVDNYRMGLRHE